MTPEGKLWASTLWSTVLHAVDRDSTEGREALARLAERYWKPLYFYVRRKCGGADEAQDRTQAFFAYLLDRDLLKHARPERGSFRAFLRTVADRFLADQRDREAAIKRGGDAKRLSLDFAEAETDFAYGPRASESPDEAYERMWAEETLARVLRRFKEDCAAQGRPLWHDVLRSRFGFKGGAKTYEEIAKEHSLSEANVTNYLHRGLARFRELLVEEIRESVSSPDELTEELRIFRTMI